MTGLPTRVISSTSCRDQVGLLCHLYDEVIDCLTHHGGELGCAMFILHAKRHPAHQVFAKANLRVHHAGAGQHLAIGKIA